MNTLSIAQANVPAKLRGHLEEALASGFESAVDMVSNNRIYREDRRLDIDVAISHLEKFRAAQTAFAAGAEDLPPVPLGALTESAECHFGHYGELSNEFTRKGTVEEKIEFADEIRLGLDFCEMLFALDGAQEVAITVEAS